MEDVINRLKELEHYMKTEGDGASDRADEEAIAYFHCRKFLWE